MMRPQAGRQGGWSLLEALAAIVVVGLGIALFTKVQGMSSRGSGSSSKQLVAIRMVEKYLEDTRINIAKNMDANFPPKSAKIAAVAPHHISLESTVGDAFSPATNQKVANVVRIDIACRWTSPVKDSLKVTTYVAKRF